MNFEIETCPICHVSLILDEHLMAKVYYCPQNFHSIYRYSSSFPNRLSHYKVTIQTNFQDKQEIIAYPYQIEITDVILVYKYIETGFKGMRYILQLNEFKITSEEAMRKKIENLIPFI